MLASQHTISISLTVKMVVRHTRIESGGCLEKMQFCKVRLELKWWIQNNLEEADLRGLRLWRDVFEEMTSKAENEFNICTRVLGSFRLQSNLMLHSNSWEWKDVKPWQISLEINIIIWRWKGHNNGQKKGCGEVIGNAVTNTIADWSRIWFIKHTRHEFHETCHPVIFYFM